ncbi:MAG TPA: phospho-N-acetylmuramoyl-pentapeptide-transferase [Mycobacteriales bacterium]|nr:phospho-N-acetylmuramoyl-pentapeptide-transferase [Mycobacteriales bacterium]
MRSVLFAGGLAFLISLFCTPIAIKYLTRMKIGQEIREEGPKHHATKKGTPTMGGIVFILATVVAYAVAQLLVMGKEGRGVTATGVVLLGVFVAMGLVGFLDDYIKVRRRRSLGLNKRGKIFGQLLVGIGFGILALEIPSAHGLTVGSTAISFVRDIDWMHISKIGAVLLFTFVVIATSNAVNLTDGLDGLATGSSVMVLIAFSLIGYWQFRHLPLYEVRDPLEIALVAAAAAGACFGFLWWNAYPARIFMGDTGALGLGGLIAGLAVATKTILLLPIMGVLFVIIAMSVIIQIISFRSTGKRVFRMAPLQHHFELAGWGEVTIVIRFWIIAAIGVASALGIFYLDFLAVPVL